MGFKLKKYADVDFDEYWDRIKITVLDYITLRKVEESTLKARRM